MVDSQPPSDLESQGEPCDKGHVGEGKIKKSSAPCEARPNLDRRSDQRNTNLCREHWPHVFFFKQNYAEDRNLRGEIFFNNI